MLGWIALPATVIWIVAVTNSVNLIDGLDGLAVGVSADCLLYNAAGRGDCRRKRERTGNARGTCGSVHRFYAL